MPKHPFIKAPWILCFLLLTGCATRYVERDMDKDLATDSIGDVVVFANTQAFKTNPPTCLGVLPIMASKKDFEPTGELRKALHAHLAPTGIALIPLQRIDQIYQATPEVASNLQKLSQALGCDTLISGEVYEKGSRYWGVYSEVKLGAVIRITRVSTGQVIWKGKHVAIARDGGLPVNPLSIIGGTISAGLNLRDEQITRTTNDLARRLVTAMPGLQYTDQDRDLVAKPPVPVESTEPQSVHAFISSIENNEQAVQVQKLTLALEDQRWADPKDRIVLSDDLLKKDKLNVRAMFSNATARLELNQPDESLAMTNRLLQVDKSNPEFQFLKGRALMQMNKPADAIDPFLQAAGAPEPQAVYFTALGLAYNQIGNHEIALAALSRSLKMQPDNPYVLMQQAISQVGVGDDEAAVSNLKKSMILSIIAKDKRNASRAFSLIKSMDLRDNMSLEELNALDTKIQSL